MNGCEPSSPAALIGASALPVPGSNPEISLDTSGTITALGRRSGPPAGRDGNVAVHRRLPLRRSTARSMLSREAK